MAQLSVKRFSKSDETRPFAGHGSISLLNFGARSIGLATFEPGWKWSADVGPIAGTKSCQVSHACYILSGKMHLIMDNGEVKDIEAGDVALIPPGHDGWVVGSEACRVLDFGDIDAYARPAVKKAASETRAEARH